MRDDEGVDTVFGALVLIATCVSVSAMLFVAPSDPSSNDRNASDQEMLDYALCATILLPCEGPDGELARETTVGDCLVDLAYSRGYPGFDLRVDAARGQISPIIDFYLTRCGGWSLTLIFDDEERVEVASRSTENMAGADVFAAERVIFDSGNETCAIRVEYSG